MWNGNEGSPILTDEEIGRVMAQAATYGSRFRASEQYRGDGLRWTALLSVLANCGARLSEALTMHRAQIDFTRGRITFRTLKRHRRPCPDCRTRSGYRVHVRPELTACPHCGTPMPKAKPVYRTMPLYPQVAEAIQAYLTTHDSSRVFPPGTATSANAERVRAWRMFQQCCKRAGVTPKKLHSLRASGITRVLKETKDLIVARDYAGHSNLASTSRYAFSLDFDEKIANLPVIQANGNGAREE